MPERNKVAFIICTNDPEQYDDCVSYIRRLTVPDKMRTEVIPIRGAAGLCSAYQRGMRCSDAAYKVYLHHDTCLINRNFIPDMLACFERHPNAGMLGMIGRKDFSNRRLLYQNELFGALYETWIDQTVLYHRYTAREDERVLYLDGLMMMTRVDLPWREDLFDGWHLYDVSQSLEMIRAGYELWIPYMETPWALHACGSLCLDGYQRLRDRAIAEYREFFDGNAEQTMKT